MDRPPVHELSAVNGHSLRFKYRSTLAVMVARSRGPSKGIISTDLGCSIRNDNVLYGPIDGVEQERVKPVCADFRFQKGHLLSFSNMINSLPRLSNAGQGISGGLA
jgi:hypothetical protein